MRPFFDGDGARLVLRSLFVSDLHLGSAASRAEAFLEFLNHVEAERIYLVGDIFELWSGARLYWSGVQLAVLHELQARMAAGTRVIYLPGNHDLQDDAADFARRHGFEQMAAHRHETVAGDHYLVLHGDQFDMQLLRSQRLTRLGARLDGLLHRMDHAIGRRLGRRLRPGGWLVRGFHMAVLLGKRHERRLSRHAREQGCQGIICGHFHLAALKQRQGVTYANCGDWVHSLTALSECPEGRLRLLRWSSDSRSVQELACA